MFQAVAHDLKQCWRSLALASLLYKIVAVVALAPIVAILFRWFLVLRGSTVLTDEEIVRFFARPLGWTCLIVVGAVSLAVLAFEQAALMVIICAAREQRRVTVLESLRFSAAKATNVLRLTLRMMFWGLLIAAPFVVAAVAIYLTLLTQYDINYYLAERPPEFWTAVGLGVVLGLGLVLLGIQVAAVFLLALPLVLFEGVAPGHALLASRGRTKGRRSIIWGWVAGWFLASSALSAAALAGVDLVGRFAVPRAVTSLPLLLFVVGLVLVLWFTVNLIVSLLSTAAFAALLIHLYCQLGGQASIDRRHLSEPAGAATHSSFDFTRRRLLALLAAAALVSLVAGVSVVRNLRLEDHTEITAHRGSSMAAPENTLAAVRQAIADGADWVEIDVQETADGEVVVMHDSDFKKIAGTDLKIWDATREDLAALDIGSWFAPEFADQRVPTLDDVLAASKGKIRVNIELKYYGHDKQLEERVVECVERQGMQGQIVVMSLKQEAVEKMKRLRPTWTVGQLTAVALGDLTLLEADFLAVNTGMATRRFVAEAHRAGKRVYVWTVNNPNTMSIMMSRGADNLITDVPLRARQVRRQRAELITAKRVLLEVATYFDQSAAFFQNQSGG